MEKMKNNIDTANTMQNENATLYNTGMNYQFPAQASKKKNKKRLIWLLPVIIMSVSFVLMFIVGFISSGEKDGQINQYAGYKYYEIFASSSAPEDNILIVFAVDEEYDDYSTVAIVGDNVDGTIKEKFSGYNEYYDVMDLYFDDGDFIGFIDTNFVNAIDYMADEIEKLDFKTNFKSQSDRSNLVKSEVINDRNIKFDESAVNAALESFTEKTGIPCVVIFENEYNIFGEFGESASDSIFLLCMVVFIFTIPVSFIIALILVAKKVIRRSKERVHYTEVKGERYTVKKTPAEKCNKNGCDGKVKKDDKMPWEIK